MEDDRLKLIQLFERKINLLLEKNKAYSRFKRYNSLKRIKHIISGKNTSREEIIDLGFLIHISALKFRLNMYKNLTPFTILSFKKDLQDTINSLHAYKRQRVPKQRFLFESTEAPKIVDLIPPLLEFTTQRKLSSDNPELYNEILDMLEVNVGKIDMEIPEEIIKQMQHIDLKKIYNELPELIEKKENSTVRKLTSDFPVFENDKLSLVAVFNEILFLANEGKVCLRQMEGDVGISTLL